MLSDKVLLSMRRGLSALLSIGLLGIVSPALAHAADDDDDAGTKKEVRVYRMGDDDEDDSSSQKWNERDDDRDSDRDNDRDDDENAPQVFRYKTERADAKGGYLGVRVQDITKSLMKARDLSTDEGALVNRVEDESPAENAGIMRGDVIVQVGREGIENSEDLIKAMRGIEPGTKVEVVVLRDGARKNLRVEVAKRPRDMMMTAPGFRWRSEGMDPDQMRELREHMRQMDPEKMKELRGMMVAPEMKQEMESLRHELEELKSELKDLREELDDTKARTRGRRSGS